MDEDLIRTVSLTISDWPESLSSVLSNLLFGVLKMLSKKSCGFGFVLKRLFLSFALSNFEDVLIVVLRSKSSDSSSLFILFYTCSNKLSSQFSLGFPILLFIVILGICAN